MDPGAVPGRSTFFCLRRLMDRMLGYEPRAWGFESLRRRNFWRTARDEPDGLISRFAWRSCLPFATSLVISIVMAFQNYPLGKLKHETNGCGGEIEIKIDKKKKTVITRCKKCMHGSEIVAGKVTKDNIPMPTWPHTS